jgi:hypothetical protein
MDLCIHNHFFGDIWLLFGVLFSVCVFVGIPKRDEYLSFFSCYKLKNETQIKNGHFVNVYPCIRANKSPFLQNKYTKDGRKGK